ncbi:heparinase II/III family protein [Coraliomargarita sp. SDUM461003]|uniref:Heparinase II/III family protein n=1 Tax=Thalassobacterium maritimum TaxID=3041265 RepID=A0ABU1AT73_9BACT|nr:heparinase II/III family protein [Coraliomargarita sp. SDUM461003]MDQ8206345.1 heparinase II/III family protein [Coraliomargarita sp. SDUM461003]
MSLFLTTLEQTTLKSARKEDPVRPFYYALINRVEKRAAAPGLSDLKTSCEWWHFVSEYLTDAAMVYALKPSNQLAAWLRETTLSIARRPIDDWVGPPFRSHQGQQQSGHLETAHLTWSVAIALDLAAEAFTEQERLELGTVLRETGIPLCQRWLDQNQHMANWRCVMNAGVAVAAAVLNDAQAIGHASEEYTRCSDIFQPDGSDSESLQYGNYAGYTLMLAREALIRRDAALSDELPISPWVHKPRWDACSLFYQKPLLGWGAYPRPRSANFNDSAAIYRASGDFLLHIAAQAKKEYPSDAGLARWLFDNLYLPCTQQGPFDRASFGFVNDFGFLTLPLLCQAAQALEPPAAGLTELETFSSGDVIARDAWNGKTILAVHGAGDAMHGPGHLHGDLNSFILVHNQERLLVDPGHSCYRNLIHDLECSSLNHNTCTFKVEDQGDGLHLQEELLRGQTLQQSRSARRILNPTTREPGPPIQRGGQRLFDNHQGQVKAIASEVAALYGPPMTRFARFWFLCGSHALFVVDHIVSTLPVQTSWSWLLNNRDGELDLKLVQPDRLVARRGNAGMKLFHLADSCMNGPLHGYVHDAYHPLPNQLGEGQPGSGQLIRWTEKSAATERTVVHAIALDDPAAITQWHLRGESQAPILESPGASESWKLEVAPDASQFVVTELASQKQYTYSVKDND